MTHSYTTSGDLTVQFSKFCQFIGEFAGELIVAEVEIYQFIQISKFGWYCACKLIGVEPQRHKILGEVAKFGRYLPGELIVVERQKRQVGSIGQLRRYCSRQSVVTCIQRD